MRVHGALSLSYSFALRMKEKTEIIPTPVLERCLKIIEDYLKKNEIDVS